MVAPSSHEGFRYPVRAGRPQTTSMPSVGDFVVLSLNPLLSVAHLDAEAEREAASLRTGKYVALITNVLSDFSFHSIHNIKAYTRDKGYR